MTSSRPSDSPPGATLNIRERWGFALLGVCALVWSYHLFDCAQLHRSTETVHNRKGDWTETEKFEEVPRVTEPLALLLIGSLGLIIALNGRRIYSLSIGNNTIKTAPEVKIKADQALERPETVEALDKELEPNADAPFAEPEAGTTIVREGKVYRVYGLYDLPSEVIGDALTHWPKDESPPKNAADLVFALRRDGRGNHSWLLKFKGKRELLVSYGGKSKEVPTVRFS